MNEFSEACEEQDVIIAGAGFTGLTAAYCLSRMGVKVHLFEEDDSPGGLAGTFELSDGVVLEKFYHHWFNNDMFVPDLVKELGMEGDVIIKDSRTGMYLNGRLWRLSTPIDLLRFTELTFFQRIRLGLLLIQVRLVKDWRKIENLSVREWLEGLCGKKIYRTVWEPLINAKFSIYAEDISAVWMWKKLALRGGTRNKKGSEELAYFKGGFGRLAEALVAHIKKNGGSITYGDKIQKFVTTGDKIEYLITASGQKRKAKQYLLTPALPLVADMFPDASTSWLGSLRRVNYLGNICVTLRLRKSLSDTYWLNINDPGFPFVGVIEHTNFDSPDFYAGTHIVYLSRYLSTSDPLWSYSEDEYLKYCIDHVKQMFPDFQESWLIESSTWRAKYAQPVTERGYSEYLPSHETPFRNGHMFTMAQIYPEDRGTNYAIREGRRAAEKISEMIYK